MCISVNCICLVYIFVILGVFVILCVYCCFTLDAGLLARSQYPEGPATGHLDIAFSRFPCVYKRMLRWSPSFQVATTCFSCSPSDLNFLVTYLIFMYMQNNHCHRVITQLQGIIIIIIIIIIIVVVIKTSSNATHLLKNNIIVYLTLYVRYRFVH